MSWRFISCECCGTQDELIRFIQTKRKWLVGEKYTVKRDFMGHDKKWYESAACKHAGFFTRMKIKKYSSREIRRKYILAKRRHMDNDERDLKEVVELFLVAIKQDESIEPRPYLRDVVKRANRVLYDIQKRLDNSNK